MLIAALVSMQGGRLTAQTFKVLHSFSGSEGANPRAGLVLSDNTLYGTASAGGVSGVGMAFSLNTDGTGFTNLHSFIGNVDGIGPNGLALLGNTLYGTASSGGGSNYGTVFALTIHGNGFRILHTFIGGSEGANPSAGMTLSSNTMYGTTQNGDSSVYGTVFSINTDGTGFTNLHTFSGISGAHPAADMVLLGSALYGTTLYGGTSLGTVGTVFSLNIDGTGFTILHSFSPPEAVLDPDPVLVPFPYFNFDGASPTSLILSGNTLFGTATELGLWDSGSVFKLNPDGSAFSVLSFLSSIAFFQPPANTDGTHPTGRMVLSSNTLYGTAQYGGAFGSGAVFTVNTDGTGFKNFYSFTSGADGGNPVGGLILSGNIIYGATVSGGSSGYGTVFSITLPPQLSISPSGRNLVLMWPTNFTGFTLQSTTNLSSPVWTTNSFAAVVINGQNTVTNPISGTQQFFRLSQ